MPARPSAPATERNQAPILEVLRTEFSGLQRVLEIGSGTGQHAVHFAAALPHLFWQTSDLPGNHAGIAAWIEFAGLPNVAAPLCLDVASWDAREQQHDAPFDAVFSANTAHIMSFPMVESMFRLVAELLPDEGLVCLYGPFKQDGSFSSESNASFDRSLKSQDSRMGIRDLEDLDRLAADGALARYADYAMPSNNLMVIWRKTRMP